MSGSGEVFVDNVSVDTLKIVDFSDRSVLRKLGVQSVYHEYDGRGNTSAGEPGISPVAIAHGSLAIEITEDAQVSQPVPFAPENAATTVVPGTGIAVTEQKASLVQVSGVTLGDVVRALNVLGVTPRDLISILQALKSAGALQAELELI